MSRANRPTVLVVEDEPSVADLYAHHLADSCEVRTAYGGEEALELVDESVDVVLLDRRMPDLSGRAVLEAIRARGLDCRVAMVTAVEPDVDIVEMGFDEYLTKPVSGEELRETVAHLVELNTYRALVQEYFSLSAKLVALQSQFSTATLEASSEYRALTRRFAQVKEEARPYLDQAMADGSAGEVVGRMIEDEPDDESS